MKNLGIQSIVVLALLHKSNQTKKEIQDKIKVWGGSKNMLNWFKGGNFNQRLINTGIIFENGENSKKEIIFSLTKGLGNKKAKEIIEKIKKNTK